MGTEAKWNAETITDTRLNSMTHLVGTTAQRTASTAWPVNMLWWDTDENQFYRNSGSEGTPTSTLIITSNLVLPALTNLAAYHSHIGFVSQLDITLPFTQTVSSTKTEVKHIETPNPTPTNIPLGDGTNTRIGNEGQTELASKRVTSIIFDNAGNIGSPTGNVTVAIRDSSGTLRNSNIVGDAADIVSGLVRHFIDDTTTANNDRVNMEYAGGDSSNKLVYVRGAVSQDANVVSRVFTTVEGSAGFEFGNMDVADYYGHPLAYNNTTGHWESTSEATPWIKWDYGTSHNDRVASIYLMKDANNTATNIDIQYSDDDSTYITLGTFDLSTISADTEKLAICKMPPTSHRYWRLQAQGTVVLALVYAIPHSVTDAEGHTHGTADFT